MRPIMLLVILMAAGASLLLNALYIAHELGWFPHGKRRKEPAMTRRPLTSALGPTLEEARAANRDSQVKSAIADRLRRAAHREVYEYKEPESHFRKVLTTFRQDPTPSRCDDVLNLMNDITSKHELTASLEALVEEAIEATATFRKHRSEG